MKRTLKEVSRSKYVCVACGHPILPDDPLAFLSLTERTIFNVIYRAGQAGITRGGVYERVYANKRNAADSAGIVSAHVNNMNKKLRWIGMEVHSSHGTGNGSGKEATYRVRRLPQDVSEREGNGTCA